MSEKPLFEGVDEFERTYAPQQLPADDEARVRVEADEGGDAASSAGDGNEPPIPAPVASMGNAPSAAMAPPNLGHEERGGAPGDPAPQAQHPFDSEETEEN